MGDAPTINQEAIAGFCQKWGVDEFALFGSVLRDDFSDSSDIDVLLSLPLDTHIDLFDWVEMKHELESLFGRHVDMVEKSTIRNPYRRKAILESYRVVYAA